MIRVIFKLKEIVSGLRSRMYLNLTNSHLYLLNEPYNQKD